MRVELVRLAGDGRGQGAGGRVVVTGVDRLAGAAGREAEGRGDGDDGEAGCEATTHAVVSRGRRKADLPKIGRSR